MCQEPRRCPGERPLPGADGRRRRSHAQFFLVESVDLFIVAAVATGILLVVAAVVVSLMTVKMSHDAEKDPLLYLSTKQVRSVGSDAQA